MPRESAIVAYFFGGLGLVASLCLGGLEIWIVWRFITAAGPWGLLAGLFYGAPIWIPAFLLFVLGRRALLRAIATPVD